MRCARVLAPAGRPWHPVDMNILLVGNGGREHALAARIKDDRPDATLFIAPGNPGTARLGENVPIGASMIEALAEFAAASAIDLTIVGPEAPLADGIADRFEASGLPVFGPTRMAARIEASKAFSKQLMAEEGVPTAAFETFTDHAAASDYVSSLGAPIVVKASGLAAGKGAVVCLTVEDAQSTLSEMMVESRFGEAGQTVVVEQFLEGEELSVFFVTDGVRAVPLVPSRDHKRRFEGDTGPNTGGMGAYAPVAGVTDELIEEVRTRVADPVLRGLAARGFPYRGFLYAGLMLTADGLEVIEFNCRMGDPETQAVLPLMTGNLTDAMFAVAHGDGLGDWSAGKSPRTALTTVMVSDGYPGAYETGFEIQIPDGLEGPDLHIFQAGTATKDGRLVTAGGRVLGVTGLGDTLAEAAARSREAVSRIQFEGAAWRTDIGHSESV